jgi:hypothetical protein
MLPLPALGADDPPHAAMTAPPAALERCGVEALEIEEWKEGVSRASSAFSSPM